MQNTVSSDVFMLQAYSSVVNISYTVQNTVRSIQLNVILMTLD